MTGELDSSCNPGLTGLWPHPWSRKNRESAVRWAGPPQSCVLQAGTPCPACDPPHRARASLRQLEIPTCESCNLGGGLELPRPAAHPAELRQAAFFPEVPRPLVLRAGCVCSGERRTARPPAWPVRASALGQVRRFLPPLARTAFPSQESKTPVSCLCQSGLWQSHLCPVELAEWLPSAPVSAS